ncbi:MAG: hypothetical protein HY537_08400 [Deltaproteobacteria bacterium]|nr:hypothetical protein [Deltaproteobacteria bacterium]
MHLNRQEENQTKKTNLFSDHKAGRLGAKLAEPRSDRHSIWENDMRKAPWEILQAHFLTILLLASLVRCTDRRQPIPSPAIAPKEPQSLVPAAEVQFRGDATQIFQMAVRDGLLHVTGKPLFYAIWDISADPENPSQIFSAVDEFDNFAPSGWVVDRHASQVLTLAGKFAILGGTAGLSILDLTSINHPKEVRRYPAGQTTVRDDAYVYSGFVMAGGMGYGFRNDFIYYLDTSRLPELRLMARDSYEGKSICCIRNAAESNGMLYVALQTKLWVLRMGNDGRFSDSLEVASIQAVRIVSTGRFLYIQHSPTPSIPNPLPAGIYVFDKATGAEVAYLNTSPLVFTISENDSHIYENLDNQSVRVSRITWQ